jgi:hypothetical protein
MQTIGLGSKGLHIQLFQNLHSSWGKFWNQDEPSR